MRTALQHAIALEPGIVGEPAATPFSRILIIDRDDEFREMMAQALGRHGFVIDSCRQIDGVLFDHDSPPDVAVIELGGADRPSLSRISRLRERTGWADVPMVCVSHLEQPLLRVLAFEAGADDFVVKPVNSDELVARIRVQIRRAQRVATLLSQSRIDALTGLLNRRGAMAELERTLAWSRRSVEPCSLLLLDVDGLKQINDRLGHASGDALLQAVGATLQQLARREDAVARLGGDEFVVVLPRADGPGARQVVARIREQLAALSIEGVVDGVCASIGVATSAPGELAAESMLAAADEQMYIEKRAAKRSRSPLRVVRDDESVTVEGAQAC